MKRISGKSAIIDLVFEERRVVLFFSPNIPKHRLGRRLSGILFACVENAKPNCRNKKKVEKALIAYENQFQSHLDTC